MKRRNKEKKTWEKNESEEEIKKRKQKEVESENDEDMGQTSEGRKYISAHEKRRGEHQRKEETYGERINQKKEGEREEMTTDK